MLLRNGTNLISVNDGEQHLNLLWAGSRGQDTGTEKEKTPIKDKLENSFKLRFGTFKIRGCPRGTCHNVCLVSSYSSSQGCTADTKKKNSVQKEICEQDYQLHTKSIKTDDLDKIAKFNRFSRFYIWATSPDCRSLIRTVLELTAPLENSSSCVNKQHVTEEDLHHSACPQSLLRITAGEVRTLLPHNRQRNAYANHEEMGQHALFSSMSTVCLCRTGLQDT